MEHQTEAEETIQKICFRSGRKEILQYNIEIILKINILTILASIIAEYLLIRNRCVENCVVNQ